MLVADTRFTVGQEEEASARTIGFSQRTVNNEAKSAPLSHSRFTVGYCSQDVHNGENSAHHRAITVG